MTDITPLLNELLKAHDARPTADPSLTLKNIDEFLKEAYRINAHITSLNLYLKKIRQSYLSTAPPPRRTNLSTKDGQWKYLTDRQREEIDAETKQLLRELSASIRNLADAEELRQKTATTLTRKKYSKLGLLGSWAAGGGAQTKSGDQELEEAKSHTVSGHRESVLWYLRQKLQECGSFQATMMEKRILREVEKRRSLLANSDMGSMPRASFEPPPIPAPIYKRSVPEQTRTEPEDELSAEQIQMFEKQSQDMLKHYESTLDQVRTAEKSLVEISELQTQLVNNLHIQSEHIDQLERDSHSTKADIDGGNKQLKKAAERKSTAKYVFYASCGLSLFLVTWDLIF